MELAVVAVEKEVENDARGGIGKRGWLDALPYVDVEMNIAGTRARAEQMVRDEIRRHPERRRPLGPLPKLDSAKVPLSAMELERIDADLPAEEIDLSVRNAKPPTGAQESEPEAWQVSLRGAETRYAMQVEQLVNLELLRKYGASAWLLSNREIELALKRMRQEAESLEQEVEDVNKRRKVEQTQLGEALSAQRSEYKRLLAKNRQLLDETARLERKEKEEEEKERD